MNTKRIYALAACACLYGTTFAQQMYLCKGNKYKVQTITEGLEIDLAAECDSITFDKPLLLEEETFNDTIFVTYEGTRARVSQLPDDGSITATVNDADVIISNTIATREITTVISGNSNSGSFTYNGDYKTTVILNGIDLTGSTAEAININCGKRIALELAEGTVNNLSDNNTDNGQKAAFYTKGHLEISGNGSFNLNGNVKHALSSKEYMLVKKTTGTINIQKSNKDGIHAGQYFQQNGGIITIKNVGDDGIQAEVTDDTSDEQNGQLITKGGSLYIEVSGEDVSAIKSDSLLTIKDGAISIKATGNAAKGIKSNTDIEILGGTTDITNSGGGVTINSESETAKGISADGDIQLIDGKVTITMSGAGGKGIKTDKRFIMGDKENATTPQLTVTTTGAMYSTGTSSNTGNQNGGWGGRPGGFGGGGFGGNNSSSGSSAKAVKTTGELILYSGESNISTSTNGAEGLESKTSVSIEGGMHYMKCYDDCINSSGNIYFNGGVTVCYATNNDAVDSNAGRAGAITIGDGIVFAYTSAGSPEEGLDCDNNSYIRITGNGTAISAGGAQGGGTSSSTISNATQGYTFITSSISYTTGRYYTLADSQGKNLITYSFPASVSSSLALFTAKGMTKGNTYSIKYSTNAPTDATTSFHGLYIGSSATGTTNVTSFTAK